MLSSWQLFFRILLAVFILFDLCFDLYTAFTYSRPAKVNFPHEKDPHFKTVIKPKLTADQEAYFRRPIFFDANASPMLPTDKI